jgi:hypothetical protein
VAKDVNPEVVRLRAENETLRALLRAACEWDASPDQDASDVAMEHRSDTSYEDTVKQLAALDLDRVEAPDVD